MISDFVIGGESLCLFHLHGVDSNCRKYQFQKVVPVFIPGSKSKGTQHCPSKFESCDLVHDYDLQPDVDLDWKSSLSSELGTVSVQVRELVPGWGCLAEKKNQLKFELIKIQEAQWRDQDIWFYNLGRKCLSFPSPWCLPKSLQISISRGAASLHSWQQIQRLATFPLWVWIMWYRESECKIDTRLYRTLHSC